MVENRVLERIFGPTRKTIAGGWWKCIMGSFVILIHPHESLVL
jgi:hypothetical protein